MAADIPDFRALIGKVATGDALSAAEAHQAFGIMMSGDATPAQMGGFLMALRVRGESVDEITGGAMAMRERMTTIQAPAGAMDIVGTGGDATGTLNISTATALVVAACGIPVAKHGNRALSSKTGAADVLTTLGVNIDADFALVQAALDEAGICFMMAPRHHGAMRNVAGPRMELAIRTIFNLLGPLSNPANVKRLLIGAFARQWIRPMAETMRELGAEKVWVAHGSDGTDELTSTGPSFVAALEDGDVREFEVSPEAAGLPVVAFEEIKGGDHEENAAALRGLLDGQKSGYRTTILYNAAAALLIADRTTRLSEGVEIAADAIDSGKAANTLETLCAVTNRAVATPS